MPTHLQYVSKDAVGVTVVASLKNLQEPLTQLGVLDSGGQPSKLLDAKPPKEGDPDPGSFGFWWDSRFNPLQPIVISQHGVESQLVHVIHLPSLNSQKSAEYVSNILTENGLTVEATTENGKSLMTVTGDEAFPMASMAMLAEEGKLLLALSPKLNDKALNDPTALFFTDDLAAAEAKSAAKSKARKARVKAARDKLNAIKQPLLDANEKDPAMLKASADRDCCV